jgi:hypothetical protein
VLNKLLTELPSGSVLIVINRSDAMARHNLLQELDHNAEALRLCSTSHGLIWRDLRPGWFAPRRDRRLAIETHYVGYRLLGGWLDEKQRLYPLAVSARDRKDRHLLLWNFAEPIPRDDPRWTLILRNSLLWAKKTRNELNKSR